MRLDKAKLTINLLIINYCGYEEDFISICHDGNVVCSLYT